MALEVWYQNTTVLPLPVPVLLRRSYLPTLKNLFDIVTVT